MFEDTTYKKQTCCFIVRTKNAELEKLKKENIEQKEQIKNLTGQITKQETLIQKIPELHKLHSEKEAYKVIDKLRDVGTDFTDKISICNSILKYINRYMNVTGGVVGSFIRQMMELPFLMKDVYKINDEDTECFGNPIDHDVDIVLIKDIGDKYKHNTRRAIINVMNRMNKEIGKLKFGDYIVSEIGDVTVISVDEFDPIGKQNLLNVPHYQIRLDKSETDIYNLNSSLVVVLGDEESPPDRSRSIIIDIMAWYPEYDPGSIERNNKRYYSKILPTLWPTTDFDVNSLVMSKTGFTANSTGFNLFDMFENIEKRRTRCLIDLKQIHNEMNYCPDKIGKIICLKQLSFFIGNRMKILSNGYKQITGNIPDYGIESEKEDKITLSIPPYLVYKLECGHDISSHVLTSLMQKNTAENFNFLCNKCGKDFKLKFSNKFESDSETKSEDELKSENEFDDELPPLEEYNPQPVSTVSTDRSKLKPKRLPKHRALQHEEGYS